MTLFVGLLRVELWMPANASLKDRRRVVRSVLDRTKARHNVAVAEVEPGSDPRRACLAFACVGAKQQVVREALEAVLRRIEAEAEAEVTAAQIEIR